MKLELFEKVKWNNLEALIKSSAISEFVSS